MTLPFFLEQLNGRNPMTYYTTKTSIKTSADLASDLEEVCSFLSEHGKALAKAAHLLGGPTASARVFLLTEAVHDTLRLTKTQRRQLVELHRLLMLENVADPNRIEAACFAAIDPASPFVPECCLLADQLEALLRRICHGNYASEIEMLFREAA